MNDLADYLNIDLCEEVEEIQKRIKIDQEYLKELRSIKNEKLSNFNLYGGLNDKKAINNMLNDVNTNIESKYQIFMQ